MIKSVTDLIASLDDHFEGADEDAQAALIERGDEVVEPLIAALPTLGPGGQLCAIEVFNALHAVQAGDALIPLLRSENEIVRSWTAEALGELRIETAASALQQASRASRERGTPLNYYEPLSIRRALTQLGARTEVVPPITAEIALSIGRLERCWPAGRVAEVLDDLTEHEQAVLFIQVWKVKETKARWQSGTDWTNEIDFSWPWSDVVAKSRELAALAAESVPIADDLVVTISWINEDDR